MAEVILKRMKPDGDLNKGKVIPVLPDQTGVFFRGESKSKRSSIQASVQGDAIVISIERRNKDKTTQVVKTFIDKGAKGIIVQAPDLGRQSRFVIDNL
jgi:ABC-type sugar transport system substrate-binding protein